MPCRFSSLLVLAALAAPAAAFGLECPPQERKEQHGAAKEWYCVPRKAQECAEGRKFNIRSRTPVWGFCEADPNARQGKCAVGETAETKNGRELCKPGYGNGGKCGKGRKSTPWYRDPSVVVCEDDKNAKAEEHDSLNCPSGERPYHPTNKSIKPYCEAVGGRCGSLRTAVNEVPGHQRCIPR